MCEINPYGNASINDSTASYLSASVIEPRMIAIISFPACSKETMIQLPAPSINQGTVNPKISPRSFM